MHANDLWNFENELEKMRTCARKDLKIIAFYWAKKGYVFENKEQFSAALRRELRAAKQLIGYTGVQVGKAIKHCEAKYPEWTLETVGKRITDIVNKKT